MNVSEKREGGLDAFALLGEDVRGEDFDVRGERDLLDIC